ncbi:MAG: N-methyl-L-tryptophan oxidase [Planctomycetaceae bacterium]|nr:N-methyl-L-tryptophan oxidase [Planctomycetaceae bacterium]
MPRPIFDCIVIGTGGFGSAALYHLARRGLKVLGLEQFTPAHQLGSSHGETRIIRQAYFEHPNYVPLLLRGYELFEELEQTSGKKLFEQCGLFLSGPPDGETIQGANLARKLHQIPLETVDASEYADRFPGYKMPEDHSVVFEPVAGFLRVEETVRAHLDEAQEAGATLKFESAVRSWQPEQNQFLVTTDQEEFIARKLLITAGAWASDLLQGINVPLQVRRKVLCWHPVQSASYNLAGGAGCFFFEMPYGLFYGFPSLDGQTLKLAEHTGGNDISHPETLVREELEGDGTSVSNFVTNCLPELSPQSVRQAVCMYTMTPDHHFLIDEHPDHPGLYFGAGFSGHGFKFTSVIGEVFADLISSGKTNLSIDFLSAKRFA